MSSRNTRLRLLKQPAFRASFGKCMISCMSTRTFSATTTVFSLTQRTLDVQRLTEEVMKSAYLNRIKEDFNGGIRSGVNGTPTFYVNGTRYNGSPLAKNLLEALISTK